jgi:hypothetical protein
MITSSSTSMSIDARVIDRRVATESAAALGAHAVVLRRARGKEKRPLRSV